MSGNHKFSQVTRDRTERNVRDVTNLQVPVANAAPTVAHGGQLFYNTTDSNVYVSVANVWHRLVKAE